MFDPKLTAACCGDCPEWTLCPQESPHASNTYTGYSLQNGCTWETIASFSYNGWKFSVLDEMKKLSIAKASPIGKKFSDQFRTIAKLRWDMDEIIREDSNNPYPIMKEKTIFLDDTVVFDWTRWIWQEENWDLKKFYIKTDVTWGNSFVLVDGSWAIVKYSDCCKNLHVWDVILLYSNNPTEDLTADCCSLLIQRNITAIAEITSGADVGWVTITIGWSPVNLTGRKAVAWLCNDLYLGDEVMKLFHPRNDCDIVDNCNCGGPSTDVKYTNMQHISQCMQFNVTELSRTFDDQVTLQKYINTKLWKPRMDMYREIAMTMYLGRGINGNSAWVKQETSGYLNLMKLGSLNSGCACKPIHSASGLSDDDKVRKFLDVLIAVQNSSIKQAGDTIYAVMDQRALSALLRMHQSFNKFLGVTVFTNDAQNKRLEFPEITTPSGKVVLAQDDIFGTITRNSGNILFVNKELIKSRARDHISLDESMTPVNRGSGVVIKNVTPIGQHECMKYDIMSNIGNQIVGYDKCAHAWIQGFC